MWGEKSAVGFLTVKLQTCQTSDWCWGQNTEGFSCSQKEREGHHCYCLVSQGDPNMKAARLDL